MDLDLAAVTAPTQVVEVSVHQGSVEEPPAIDAGQTPTIYNMIPVPLCATLITCASTIWLHPERWSAAEHCIKAHGKHAVV